MVKSSCLEGNTARGVSVFLSPVRIVRSGGLFLKGGGHVRSGQWRGGAKVLEAMNGHDLDKVAALASEDVEFVDVAAGEEIHGPHSGRGTAAGI